MEVRLIDLSQFGQLSRLSDMSLKDRVNRYNRLKNHEEFCFVAIINRQIVAEISVLEKSENGFTAIAGKRIYFHSFRVLDGFQGMGIGTKMISEIMEHYAKKRGIYEFTIGVKSENTGARRLYEKLGFKFYQLQCDSEKGNYDLLFLDYRSL